jgi:hypothetical protein
MFKVVTVNEETSVSYLLVNIVMADTCMHTHTCIHVHMCVSLIIQSVREKVGPAKPLGCLFVVYFIAHVLTLRCKVRKPRNWTFTFTFIHGFTDPLSVKTGLDIELVIHFLPSVSILCYILPVTYCHAFYIFQNVIFLTCFRPSNLSFGHGFPSLYLFNIIIISHAFNMT